MSKQSDPLDTIFREAVLADALRARIYKLESTMREAITALSLAHYPEYNARIVAGEVAGILREALTPKEQAK